MLILSRVCAEFTNRRGQVIFTIPPSKLLSFLEAPEEIREDPLFDSLLADGSLEAVQSLDQRRQLEADPAAPAPEGKKPRARAKAEAPVAAAEKAETTAAAGEAPSGEAAPAAAEAEAEAAAPETAPAAPKAARKAKQ